MRSPLLLLVILGLAGCRCEPALVQVEQARVVATPTPLVFPATWVGQRTALGLEVTNEGGATTVFAVSVAAPFTTQTSSLELVRGESQTVTVTFSPATPGRFVELVRLGELEVPVEGEGLEVPQCVAPGVCHDARFDASLGQCVNATSPDTTACETSCVLGQCQAGACVGALKFCDDRDACTLDACGEAQGCSHTDVVCPAPTARCQVPTCDAATGCGTAMAADGTLCGVDDCLATTVEVCVSGQCVQRVRPDSGRCANRWVPTQVPARFNHALAHDVARRRTVLFGGHGASNTSLGDTWEWDGLTWTQLLPASSPPGRESAAITWDSHRQRAVVFGGYSVQDQTILADTWEWDGRIWTRPPTPDAPAARGSTAMAYDSARHVAVLFGGSARGTLLADTWTWDGTRWTQLQPVLAPRARAGHTLAYDSARQRVVLFGGRDASSLNLNDTWEWDGRQWTELHPVTSPEARTVHSMAFDSRRQHVVLFGGMGTRGPLSDTWLWDGRAWLPAFRSQPQTQQGTAMAFDVGAGRMVLFGGLNAQSYVDSTWVWDGLVWTQAATSSSPPARNGTAIAATPQSVVLFGGGLGTGSNAQADTWTWDSTKSWTQRAPARSPPRRWYGHALAFDSTRQKVVMFGGASGESRVPLLGDMWEWDGVVWTQHTPATAPGARAGHVMAFDATRQNTVLFGGNDLTGALRETWTFDGLTWTQRPTAVSPPACYGAMAWDASRQRTVMFTGYCGNGNYVTETWEWNGTSWARMTPPRSPPPAIGFALAYDAHRSRIVLTGGVSPNFVSLAQTWEWDGSTWTERHPTVSPTGRGVSAYLPSLQKVVFFDGAMQWVFLP